MDLCSSAIFIPNLAPFKHHSDQHTVKNGLSQTVFSIWLRLLSSVSGMKLLVFDPELVLMLQDSVCVCKHFEMRQNKQIFPLVSREQHLFQVNRLHKLCCFAILILQSA